MDEKYKVVNLPIQVPKGDYCWDPYNYAICEMFEASGGNPYCNLRLGYLKYDTPGEVLKPEACKILK